MQIFLDIGLAMHHNASHDERSQKEHRYPAKPRGQAADYRSPEETGGRIRATGEDGTQTLGHQRRNLLLT